MGTETTNTIGIFHLLLGEEALVSSNGIHKSYRGTRIGCNGSFRFIEDKKTIDNQIKVKDPTIRKGSKNGIRGQRVTLYADILGKPKVRHGNNVGKAVWIMFDIQREEWVMAPLRVRGVTRIGKRNFIINVVYVFKEIGVPESAAIGTSI